MTRPTWRVSPADLRRIASKSTEPERAGKMLALAEQLEGAEAQRLDRARLWRMKAEELRTVAEQIESPQAHDSFQRMAETYDRLAQHEEEQVAGTAKRKPEAG